MVVQTILMQNALGAVQLHRTHKCNITTYKEHNQQFEIKNPKFTKAANSFLAGMQKHPIMGNRAFTFNFKFVWVLKEFSVTQMMIRVGILVLTEREPEMTAWDCMLIWLWQSGLKKSPKHSPSNHIWAKAGWATKKLNFGQAFHLVEQPFAFGQLGHSLRCRFGQMGHYKVQGEQIWFCVGAFMNLSHQCMLWETTKKGQKTL